jgi:hypothetical protein
MMLYFEQFLPHQRRYKMKNRSQQAWLHKLMTIILVSTYLSPSITLADTSQSQSIIIPAITSRWKTQGEVEKPTITIEALAKCMGATSNTKALYESVQSERIKIEHEWMNIDNTAKSLQQEHLEINDNETKIFENKKTLEKKDADFKYRSANIAKYQTSKLSAIEAKKANAEIALFNKELLEFKKQISTFNTELAVQKDKIAVFNSKITESNEKTSQFNLRADKYRVDAEQLNQIVAQNKDKCSGERSLVK